MADVITCRTMLYKALKLPNGKVVCVDVDYLDQTTKIVERQGDYLLAKSLGWCDKPQEALDRFEQQECALGDAAMARAWEDRLMSEQAKKEVEVAESKTVRHLAEIPETPKRPRGRPRKIVGPA